MSDGGLVPAPRSRASPAEAFGAADLDGAGAAALVLALLLGGALYGILTWPRRGDAEGLETKTPTATPMAVRRAGPPPPAVAARKRAFLAGPGRSDYGYAGSPAGFIDAWRPREFPGLLAPLRLDGNGGDDGLGPAAAAPEPEVYLDAAGAALAGRSQLRAAGEDEEAQLLLGNPHSAGGPAAARSARRVEAAAARVLAHFRATGGAAGGGGGPDAPDDRRQRRHPGYRLAFTSGATEALRLVAERFPWHCCPGDDGAIDHRRCLRSSLLLYPPNAHTSVVGMRGPALAQGAQFACVDTSSLDAILARVEQAERSEVGGCGRCRDCVVRHLVVLVPECNFGGDRLRDVPGLVRRLRGAATPRHEFVVLLDMARAAGTGPVDLCRLDADLAGVSFYKLFGAPTGVGALLVKQSMVDSLFSNHIKESGALRDLAPLRHYFGGGSVDLAVPSVDLTVLRREPSPLAGLVNGTCNFRGIASLMHGFDAFERLGGMEATKRHVTCLAGELVRRLHSLRHGNGAPLVQIYGDWRDDGSIVAESPGPTIAMNIQRHNGSYVGFNEVGKLAALNRPPIQLRTGCFCNPGACQKALQWSDHDLRHNYEKAGHKCGDPVDLIDGRPTGAVRVSFGKESIWEDLDAFVSFLQRSFLCRSIQYNTSKLPRDEGPINAVIKELYMFPIKSCAAQRVRKWPLVAGGRLLYDREFSLVDSSGNAMRLQIHPRMALIRPLLDPVTATLRLTAPGCKDLDVSLVADHDQKTFENAKSDIRVCGSLCEGIVWGDDAVSDWLSAFLGVRCWLSRYIGDKAHRQQRPEATVGGCQARSCQIAFANEQPLLLISENAVDQLNASLAARNEPLVTSQHFRPNLVARLHQDSSGDGDDQVHPEMRWSRLVIPQRRLAFDVTGPCARCGMVDIHPVSGAKGATLRALAEYSRINGQISFGIFLRACEGDVRAGCPEDGLWIEEGDEVECQ